MDISLSALYFTGTVSQVVSKAIATRAIESRVTLKVAIAIARQYEQETSPADAAESTQAPEMDDDAAVADPERTDDGALEVDEASSIDGDDKPFSRGLSLLANELDRRIQSNSSRQQRHSIRISSARLSANSTA